MMSSEPGVSVAAQEEPVSTTETVTTEAPETLTLHLQQPAEATASTRRVIWTTDTVDNEFMGKKKSKCCCIYKKPKKWDESDDDDSGSECETEHCRGHVEKKNG